MEPVMELCETQEDSSAILPFARSYQIEALEKAMKQNTIVFLETGSGKTLIAVMLLRSYAHLLRRPTQSCIAVFLVPTVVLVTQQAEVIKTHTDLKVGKYWGDMGVDFWDAATWNQELENHEVLVMTPKILLDALSHTYIKLDMIKVLIFDECHNARGKHPYACIMKDFYHRQLHTNRVPRIFGMTASPIKAKIKGCSYWKDIKDLENLMNSKVYTCVSEAELAQYIPLPNAKVQFYDADAPTTLQNHLIQGVSNLSKKRIYALRDMAIEHTRDESLSNKLCKLSSTFQFCLEELGLWPAQKAAEILSSQQTDIFSWGTLDARGECAIKAFNSDVVKQLSSYIPYGSDFSISDVKANMDARLLTSKVLCLVESILGYRTVKDLRCIVFVERVITAMVLEGILDNLLFKASGWRTKYIAGNQSALRSQSRNEQNKIVQEFRCGTVQILVATSILEEGLDVQSCNLVVRFDPSVNVCSFIQSRGRARRQNSDFLLMVERENVVELARVQKYLSSGEIMRKESLGHSSIPCEPVTYDEFDNIFYHVPSTGAIVTLSSSVSLINFYCSRLPSDGYFKPYPRSTIDEAMGSCTLQFPNSCPIQSVTVRGNKKILKQLACLEACKKLHEMKALTDSLVPDIVIEESLTQELEKELYDDNQANYVPPELVGAGAGSSSAMYYCYLMELKPDFCSDIPLHDIVLALKAELDSDVGNMHFNMNVEWGTISVHVKYSGRRSLSTEEVLLCQGFQVAILSILRDHNYNKLMETLEGLKKWEKDENAHFSHYDDYLVLPCCWPRGRSLLIDWDSIRSVTSLRKTKVQGPVTNCNNRCGLNRVHTKNGYVCCSLLEKCLVCTPHNGYIYCVLGFLDGMDGNSLMRRRDDELITYKSYYKMRHGIDLRFEEQPLLSGRQAFRTQNYLRTCRERREKGPSGASVELPPELCVIIMSPISVATLHSFSFVPSMMHRVESLILSANLRRIIVDDCMQNVVIPATKVLEAITTKHCQEGFHLESLETLGDSFLKYAVGRRLFIQHQNNHEGLLSIKKDRIISNAALCKLGCQRKIAGFIRDECFDPKSWRIPGDLPENCTLEEEFLSTLRKMYTKGTRKLKGKRVADAVEALIGAFLSTCGEAAALLFMKWLGVDVEFSCRAYQRNFPVQPHVHVNVRHLESLLNYSFRDASLLVEALTHGSYMLPEIPRCYQRLEFLGDSVLDHLITVHLYDKYPGMSPGQLTDLRSASVNNDRYAQYAVRAGLHRHILHASQELYRQLHETVSEFEQSLSETAFGWECEINFPKVFADIIESLAGAIFVDSGYNKEAVFKSIMPLLEPLDTPETVKLHPVRELNELCQKHHFDKKKPIKSRENGLYSLTLEVEANGVIHKHTCVASDKETAKKIASKTVLKSLKESVSLESHKRKRDGVDSVNLSSHLIK